MSNAGRLARQAYDAKPSGLERAHFQLSRSILDQITEQIEEDAADAAYAAAVSYAEALSGLNHGSTSWSMVKLYYSAFYCIRSFTLLYNIVPFHSGRDHFLLDLRDNTFLKGGPSSHHWNWNSFRRIKRLNKWYYSEDSEETYNRLRDRREDANYKFAFLDPEFPLCISDSGLDITKRIRNYRDDASYFYTYIDSHSALSYPTSLIFNLDSDIGSRKIEFSDQRAKHIKSIWPLKDRCPVCR